MGRGYGKGESISFPSLFWDVLSQLTLETMVALWGATNDRDEQRHQQMPQWIPPTLTSSSSFSRFVIRPWSSGNWSANHTKQTLHSRLICCKIQSKPRHGTWVRYESRESKLQESVLSLWPIRHGISGRPLARNRLDPAVTGFWNRWQTTAF